MKDLDWLVDTFWKYTSVLGDLGVAVGVGVFTVGMNDTSGYCVRNPAIAVNWRLIKTDSIGNRVGMRMRNEILQVVSSSEILLNEM